MNALRRSPLATCLCALVLMFGLLAGLTYYSAGTFNKRAADTRASNEAASFAQHSATLATGDAFAGYIQLLRDAEDPVVRTKTALPEERIAAMQQLLYLNVNRFDSLAIADRSGLVLATTDPAIVSVRDSATFTSTRANLSPANSDVILPAPGHAGYVEYATALHEADGTSWGFLVARADPARLWTATLLATVDGSRNVIINSAGQFAAGVPDELLGTPWSGSTVGARGVRASIDGVDSICGLAPIGKDTQIDRGLNVASCLPVSVIQAEHGQAMGKQGLVTAAGAVLAVVLATSLLTLVLRGAAPPSAPSRPRAQRRNDDQAIDSETAPHTDPAPPEDQVTASPGDLSLDDDDDPLLAAITSVPGTADSDMVPGELSPPLDIDAIALIDAYEQRNARLAERLRESVQMKLMIAATKADQAYKLAGTEEDRSTSLHAHAMDELERLRERELRAIGQELYPGLTRLGLPSALRGLAKDLADVIDVTLDVDAPVDALGVGAGRAPVGSAVRLALYRAVQDTAQAFASAGASACTVSLRRDGSQLALRIAATAPGDLDRNLLAACIISIEARGGSATVTDDGGELTLSARLPGGGVSEGSYPADDDLEPERRDTMAFPFGTAPALSSAIPGLAAEICRLKQEYAGRVELEPDAPEDLPGMPLPLHKTLLGLVEASLASMVAAGASRCAVTLGVSDSVWTLTLASDGDGSAFDASALAEYDFGLEAFEGGSSVERGAAYIRVAAEARVPDTGESSLGEAGASQEDATVTDAA